MGGSRSHPTVVVVFDPHCGNHFRELIGASPAWVTMSEANAPVVRAAWADGPKANHLTGITGFNHDDSISPEHRFLGLLDTIDLHHGPYSSKRSYTGLRVVGAIVTEDVRAALADLGFVIVESSAEGFTASRSEAAARQIRE